MHVTQRIGLILFWMLWVASTNARASEVVSPEALDGATRIDAEGVIDIVEKISDLVIIDARISVDRKQGFIEGSHSLPDIDTTCSALEKIAPNKLNSMLFYCNGVKCGRSAKSITTAQKCGYKQIYWFRGGFEEWKAKGYPFVTE